jgi:putative salt-induced outer membrane protein YdiY
LKIRHGQIMWSLGVLVWTVAAVAAADVVHMKNGDRLTGKLDGIAGQRLILETDYSDNIAVSLSSVLTVETDGPFELKLKGGDRASGRLVVADGGQAIAVDGQQPQPLVLDQVRTAGQKRLALLDLGRDWTSRAVLSAAVSTGNSETDAYNALIESKLTRNKSEHFLSLVISEEDADGETTKDQLDLDYGYKRFVGEKWFGAGNFEYFQDGLKEVDYRITAGGGVGYQFWDNSFGALSAELGASLVVEELAGESEENPAARWALKYNRHLWSKRVEAFHSHSLLVIPNRGEVIESSTGIRMALNHRLETDLRVDVDHETEPPEGSKKTDVTYALGIGVKF